MLSQRIILIGALLLGCISNLQAKTYFLPDYQQEFIYGDRVSDGDAGHTPTKPTCDTYGYYSASDRPADLDCITKNPAPGLTCYSCSCSGSYIYNSTNCSGDKSPAGKSCGGKWTQCLCNTSLFPYTTANCTSPMELSGATCGDTSTHYKECVDTTPCPRGGSSTAEKIALEGKGYACTYSYDGYKTQCYNCTDPCAGLEDKTCGSMSCQTYYPQCPSKCQACQAEASCDAGFHQSSDKLSCVPNACDGYITTCPANAVCSTCQSGTVMKYKPTGCAVGFVQRPGTSDVGNCQCEYGMTGCICSSVNYPYTAVPLNSCRKQSCRSGSNEYFLASCRDGTTYNSTTKACTCGRSLPAGVIKVTTSDELTAALATDAPYIMVMNDMYLFAYNAVQISGKTLVGPSYDKCVLTTANPLVRFVVPQSYDGSNACAILTDTTISNLNLECSQYAHSSDRIGFVTNGTNNLINTSIRFGVSDDIGRTQNTVIANEGNLILSEDIQISVAFRNEANAGNYVTIFGPRDGYGGGDITGSVSTSSPCTTLSISTDKATTQDYVHAGVGSMVVATRQDFSFTGTFMLRSDAVSIALSAVSQIALSDSATFILLNDDGFLNLNEARIIGDVSVIHLGPTGRISLSELEMYGNLKIGCKGCNVDQWNVTFEEGQLIEDTTMSTINKCQILGGIPTSDINTQEAPSGQRITCTGDRGEEYYYDLCSGFQSSHNSLVYDKGNEAPYFCSESDDFKGIMYYQ